MSDKTKAVLAYIAMRHPNASLTSLMKLCYLVDLKALQADNSQITDFTYCRYLYGPFDSDIYGYLDFLAQEQHVLEGQPVYSDAGEEYVVYKYNSEQERVDFDTIPEAERKKIDQVVLVLRGYGAKALTEIAYDTAPMRALGAQIGNREGLNQPLNLSVK